MLFKNSALKLKLFKNGVCTFMLSWLTFTNQGEPVTLIKQYDFWLTILYPEM